MLCAHQWDLRFFKKFQLIHLKINGNLDTLEVLETKKKVPAKIKFCFCARGGPAGPGGPASPR